uniref:Putative secreted peptide n=1 Tax=Anopheles braziliensis TaxID=58242 RepID=A0A2M3ZV33_9DIPT
MYCLFRSALFCLCLCLPIWCVLMRSNLHMCPCLCMCVCACVYVHIFLSNYGIAAFVVVLIGHCFGLLEYRLAH